MGNSTPLITNIYFISANVACPTQPCSSGLSQKYGNRLLLVCFVAIFALHYCALVLCKKICLREGELMSTKCEVNIFVSKVLHVVK